MNVFLMKMNGMDEECSSDNFKVSFVWNEFWCNRNYIERTDLNEKQKDQY